MDSEILACCDRELKGINAAIHDAWFSINDLEYRESIGELTVPFTHDENRELRKLRSLKGRCYGILVVRSIASWELKDWNRVVWYDFNRLKYHKRLGRLDLLTGIPILIRLHIRALEVVVHPCGESGRPVPCVPL